MSSANQIGIRAGNGWKRGPSSRTLPLLFEILSNSAMIEALDRRFLIDPSDCNAVLRGKCAATASKIVAPKLCVESHIKSDKICEMSLPEHPSS